MKRVGEYLFATIYKPVRPVTPFSNTFEKIVWEIYKAKDDREKIETIYRSINFVHPHTDEIIDINMRFMEKDGQLYQTNRGVFGSMDLPELTIAYEFNFHDFWLSILKPSEMSMSEHNTITAELTGKQVKERFENMEKENEKNKAFLESKICQHYYEKNQYAPSLKDRVDSDDVIRLLVDQIFYAKDAPYREVARKRITEKRREIAKNIIVPHWRK